MFALMDVLAMVGVSSVAAMAIIPLSWDLWLDDSGLPVCRHGTLQQAPCKRKRVPIHVECLLSRRTAGSSEPSSTSRFSQSHSVLPVNPVQAPIDSVTRSG